MMTVNIAYATIHFYRLVERARAGETIIISKAGRPLVKLVPLDDAEKQRTSRHGILRKRRSMDSSRRDRRYCPRSMGFWAFSTLLP